MKSITTAFLTYIFTCFSIHAFAQNDAAVLEKALQDMPGVSFKKISDPTEPYLRYALEIKQAVDHNDSKKGFFKQQVILTHKGFANTTVMETQGYWLFPGGNEVEEILNANNLNIEYRFCGKSIPQPMQWDYLTVEQATADLHTINQLFKTIYKNKWVSTGISKGGSTTIYYKYFYPADVDLAIPYVAPLDNSLEDKRIYNFFDTIGTPACRNKIYQFQLFLLKHEKEAVAKLKKYSADEHLTYTYTGSLGKSFEYAVLEYPFSFWQYDDQCDSIPTNNSLDDHIAALLKTSDISSFADDGIKMFEAHYYQAATQCGYYGYNIAPYKKYLHYFTANPSSIFPPKGVAVKPFDATVNEKVQRWLAESGNNILYIYGGYDTWSAAGIVVSDKVNAQKFVVPRASHATARIQNMPLDMQLQFAEAIKKVIPTEVSLDALK